jgi:hypothetical protein
LKPLDLSLFGGSGFGLHGNQILHTHSDNRHFSSNPGSVQFVEEEMKGAMPFASDADIFRFSSDQVSVDGLFVELGTHRGRTANFLAALNPKKTIYTFDSYLGLPTAWDRGDLLIDGSLFAWPNGEPLPTFLLNVELKKGWFIDTLPKFMELQDEPIAFLHVDSDVYESAAQGLDILGPKMVDGTVILFDEFYNYPNFRNQEYKAFQEFLTKYAFRAEYLAYNVFHEQVAVRIASRSAASVHISPNAK